VHVVVPDVLVPRGLVVLAGRYAIATEMSLEDVGRVSNRLLERRPELGWQLVDVLEVRGGNHKERSSVAGPPLRVHGDEDVVVPMDEPLVINGCRGTGDPAERARVVGRSVAAHMARCHGWGIDDRASIA
jgi:hypothetical protein